MEDCVVVSSSDGSVSVISMKDRDLLYQTINCQDEVLSCCVVKNGKYIVERGRRDTDVFEIMKLTSDSLVIRLCLDSLHRSIGGGHPVVYTAEKKRFISKMKKKVREQLKINP